MITGVDHLMNRIFLYIVAIRSLSIIDAQYCTFNTDCQSGNYCWNRQCTTNFGSNFPGASGLLGFGYSNNQYNGNNYGSWYPTGYGGAGYGYNNYGYGYSFGRRMVGDRCT
uniref:Uncharacterized protein n=1 Tax=Romanomermis culicivorax TaxID=13658 RepID=A0A915IAU3_ROMCU